MDEASDSRNCDGNPVDRALAEVGMFFVGARALQNTQSAVDAVTRHVSNANEADAEQDAAEQDGSLPITWPGENVLQIMELASRPGHRLLDSVDDIPWNVESVLYEDVRS